MRKIIGLDIGHCEIAAATPEYMDGKFVGISNLYLDDNKNYIIPAEVMYHEELFHYFKASPKYFDEMICGDKAKVKRRKLMVNLLAKVIKAIKTCNPSSVSPEDQILLIVGCPTSEKWTAEENRKEYEKLIKFATGVEEVRVIPESRAAMFSALADGKGRMISAYGGAMVYDFGSSTVDCTYMKTGERCVEMSWDLGAREIEKNLRKLMCQNAREVAKQKNVELAPQNNYTILERKLRAAKEAYFNGALDEGSNLIPYKFPLAEGKKLTVYLELNENSIQKALEEGIVLQADHEIISGNWKACCKEFFQKSKQYVEENRRAVKEIVLTGGASKMDFVVDYAHEVFPEEHYTVTCAKNPSFSVSYGLVWVGLVDEFEKECISIVKKNLMSKEAGKVESLKNSIKENIMEMVRQAMLSAIEKWAESIKDESLDELQSRIDQELHSRISDIQLFNKKSVSKWSKNLIKEIYTRLEVEVQNKIGEALAQKVKMKDNEWKMMFQKFEEMDIGIEKIISCANVDYIFDWRNMFNLVTKYIIIDMMNSSLIQQLFLLFAGYMFANSFLGKDSRYVKRNKIVRKAIKKLMEKESVWREIRCRCDIEIECIIDKQIQRDAIAADIESIAAKVYEIMTLKFAV